MHPRALTDVLLEIVRGRRWLNELVDDARASGESIAKRERCSVRQVNMTISLAFLAPDLVKGQTLLSLVNSADRVANYGLRGPARVMLRTPAIVQRTMS